MSKLRIAIVMALVLCAFIPGSAAPARDVPCTYTAAQYIQAITTFEVLLVEARAKADENPLYVSDEQFYKSVLADAKQCLENAAPVTTAAR
jgi:hypothetical protein